MHTVHPLPRQLGPVTLLAALLTLCVVALLLLPAPGGLENRTGTSSARGTERLAHTTASPSPASPPRVTKPVWLTTPLAPPSLAMPTER